MNSAIKPTLYYARLSIATEPMMNALAGDYEQTKLPSQEK